MERQGHWALLAQQLRTRLEPHLDTTLPLHSRIHKLPLTTSWGTEVWLKRDDELGGWLGGGKWRKYASLLPFLHRKGFRRVILIGGAHSNHLATLVPLLTQQGIAAYVLARGEASAPDIGNRLWLRTALPPERLRWVSRSEWPNAPTLATEWAEAMRADGHPVFVLPEGGASPVCAAGALTLGQDVLHNCTEMGIEFDHIVADAGTGFSVAALAHSLGWAGYAGQVHTIVMAETPEAFAANCAGYCPWFAQHLSHPLVACRAHLPSIAHRFGQVNSDVLAFVRRAAREWGVWLDPVYGAKLLHTVLHQVQTQQLAGRVLVVHGGGMGALGGYQQGLSILPNA